MSTVFKTKEVFEIQKNNIVKKQSDCGLVERVGQEEKVICQRADRTDFIFFLSAERR